MKIINSYLSYETSSNLLENLNITETMLYSALRCEFLSFFLFPPSIQFACVNWFCDTFVTGLGMCYLSCKMYGHGLVSVHFNVFLLFFGFLERKKNRSRHNGNYILVSKLMTYDIVTKCIIMLNYWAWSQISIKKI